MPYTATYFSQNQSRWHAIASPKEWAHQIRQPKPILPCFKIFSADNYVRNFGVSSSTALRKGTDAGRSFAYIETDACRRAMEWNPDIVIIKLGGNDSKPENWQYKEEFIHDYQEIIDTFKFLPSLPELYICLPAKARIDDQSKIWGINEQIIQNEIIPAIQKTAYANRIKTINLHDAYRGEENISYSDNIHPSDRGAELIADKIYKAIING